MAFVAPKIPLPRGWPEHARSAFVQALALAHFIATHVRGCVDSRIHRVRLVADRDAAWSKLAVLDEQAPILRMRLEHVASHRRPHY